MRIQMYQRVRLLTDRFAESDGLPAGRLGYVVEIYGTKAYEIEFSDENGVTYAEVVATADELSLAEPVP